MIFDPDDDCECDWRYDARQWLTKKRLCAPVLSAAEAKVIDELLRDLGDDE